MDSKRREMTTFFSLSGKKERALADEQQGRVRAECPLAAVKGGGWQARYWIGANELKCPSTPRSPFRPTFGAPSTQRSYAGLASLAGHCVSNYREQRIGIVNVPVRNRWSLAQELLECRVATNNRPREEEEQEEEDWPAVQPCWP